VAASILAIAATAAALPFARGYQDVSESARMEQATWLAASLMDEVIGHPFEDPDTPGVHNLGPDGGETSRPLFDNIDDYNGYSEAGGPAKDMLNRTISGSNLSGLWRTVSVQYTTVPNQPVSPAEVLALVTVTVYDGNKQLLSLKRLVAREY